LLFAYQSHNLLYRISLYKIGDFINGENEEVFLIDVWYSAKNEEEIIKEKVDLTVCQDFDININISKQVKEMLQHKMPVDDALPVIIDSNYSKGEFARELNIIMLTHNCSNAVVEDILILFLLCLYHQY
jgi:hypothetical protein